MYFEYVLDDQSDLFRRRVDEQRYSQTDCDVWLKSGIVKGDACASVFSLEGIPPEHGHFLRTARGPLHAGWPSPRAPGSPKPANCSCNFPGRDDSCGNQVQLSRLKQKMLRDDPTWLSAGIPPTDSEHGTSNWGGCCCPPCRPRARTVRCHP